jgi:protocatechuate 3,4-dioxygenase beta subunit
LAAALAVAAALVVAIALWGGDAAEPGARGTFSAARGDVAPALDGDAPAAVGGDLQSSGSLELDAEREAAAVVEPASDRDASRRRRAEVRGRVVDSGGAPVAGARVLAARDRDRRSVPLDAEPWAEARRECATDAEGRFAFADFDRGRLRLAVRAEGFAPFDSDAWQVGEEESLDLGDIGLALGVRLEGRVVDARGAAVEGVALIRAPDELRLYSDSDPLDVGPVVAETGAAGEFAIDVQAPGPWILIARHAAHPDLVARGTIESPGGRESVLLRFAEGASISGRVVGIPGAAQEWIVRARSEMPDDGSRTPRFQREATCAVDGTFRIDGVTWEHTYVLRAQPRRGDERRGADPIRAAGGDSGVELFVPRPIAILARVVDAASGERVVEPEAEVDLYGSDRGRRRSISFEREAGPDGAARFVWYGSVGDDAIAGVEIHARGYTSSRSTDLRIENGGALDLGTVSLAPLGVARLRAVDAESGEPLEGAVARGELHSDDTGRLRDPADVANAPFTSIASAPSGAGGIVELFGRAGASVVVRVERADRVASALIEATFGPRDAPPLDVPLGAGAMIEVEVVDTNGTALAAVEVDLSCPRPPVPERGHMVRPRSRSAATDAGGRCSFEHLAPALYAVAARVERAGAPLEPGLAAQRGAEVLVTGGETAAVRLVVPARARLEGRITENGRPLVGATVGLVARERALLEQLGELLRDVRGTAYTDARGRYGFRDLAEGKWTIAVSHPSRAVPTLASCTVTAPEERLDLDLRASLVEGEALDRRGRPVAGARIRILVPERGARDAKRRTELLTGGPLPSTDEAGLFSLRGLPPGYELTLAFSHPEFVTAEKRIGSVGSDEVRTGVAVRMERAGAVEVELLAASGSVARVPLFAQRLDEKSGEALGPRVGNVRTGSDGRGRIGGLPAGKWRVGARRGSGPPVFRDVEVRAEDVVAVRISLD